MEEGFAENEGYASLNPIPHVLSFVSAYGWWLVCAGVAAVWGYSKAQPHIKRWRNDRESARYHKDPDLMLERMEAIQAARQRQQKQLAEDAKIYAEKEKQKEEKKRQEFIERNSIADKVSGGGNRLGTKQDYLPLAGAGPSGGYRPPKKSKCGGGGCGK